MLAVSMWCLIAPAPARAAAVSRWATAAAAAFVWLGAVVGHAASVPLSFSSPQFPLAVDRVGGSAPVGLSIAYAAGACLWVLGTVIGAVALRRSRPAGSLVLAAATLAAPLPLAYIAALTAISLF
ncbi:MAG: hypothetical protein DLM61_00655, partial [Pseudonocardiales bacterium]